jgi:hypothetical protein
MATFKMSLLDELGACTDMFSKFPVVAEAAARGACLGRSADVWTALVM